MSIPVIYTKGNPDLTMAPPRVTTLLTMGQELLTRINACAADAGIELPSRQIVYPSAVPADCEQVSVLFGGWSVYPPMQEMSVCLSIRWCAQFGIMVSRCTPAVPGRTSSAPTMDRMTAAAQMASDDAELMLALLSTFDEVGADLNVSTPEPQGGYQAVLLTVTLPAFGGLD